MKNTFSILFLMLVISSSCNKDDETTPTSGTVTLDNKTYTGDTYYYYGFSFAQAEKITTLGDPFPDVTLFVNIDNPPARLTFQANNFRPSFFKLGDYPDEAAAIQAFNNLTSVGNYQWQEMADPVAVNQVWVYRSETLTYAKMRTISTVNEVREGVQYGECTFQWVYQPDGSTSFPQ
jgi:hypothetical protein